MVVSVSRRVTPLHFGYKRVYRWIPIDWVERLWTKRRLARLFYHRSEYEKLSSSMYSTIELIPPHWQLPQVCLFHLSLQTAMTANFDIKPRSQDTRLRKYYSITSRIDVWDFSKSFSDTLINWYKNRTLFTDTIAADSCNILMIAILKH